MVFTAYGAIRGHYPPEFELSMSQRTLMLQTISFLVYLLVGASIYAHIESWQYLDAVYWADFTLLTVGIGDYAPKTHLGRGLLFPFAIGGIIILGLVIGSIRSLVLERAKVKLGARMVEKHRQSILKRVKRNNSSILKPVQGPASGTSENSSATEEQNPKRSMEERERRREEFELMRQAQESAATKRKWTSLCVSSMAALVLWTVGAAIFEKTERNQNWSYFQSLYFAYTSLLTIGYGDFYPMSNSGKPFFVFWSLLAVPSLTVLISNMGDTVVKMIRDLTIYLGQLTVLPGELGIRAGMKDALSKITLGHVFSDTIEERPPGGILGDAKPKLNAEGGEVRKNDPDSAHQRVADEHANDETAEAERGDEEADLEKVGRKGFCALLAKEVEKVMGHLHDSPPRKYSFDEWAWYLKLLGEDEGDAKTHRRAPMKPRDREQGLQEAMGGKKQKWSWMGRRSPLMGNKEEAEWVLERLMKALRRELEDMRREEEGGDGESENGNGEGPRERKRGESPDNVIAGKKGGYETAKGGPSIRKES